MPTELNVPLNIRNKYLLMFVLLLAGAITLYFPALSGEFVLDAHFVVANNPLIKNPAYLGDIFFHSLFDAFKGGHEGQLSYYRPLVLTSFLLNYMLTGNDPGGFRLVNIILHAFNAFLIFCLVRRLYKDDLLSVLSAFFFLILPVHEWVVNYIVGRGDLLQTMFSLASLIFLVDYIERKKRQRLALSLVMYAAALLSREAAVVFPVFAALVVFRFVKELSHRQSTQSPLHVQKAIGILSLFVLTSALYVLARNAFFPIVTDSALLAPNAAGIWLWIRICLEYAMRFLFPWVLASSWGVFHHPVFDLFVIIGSLCLLIFYLGKREDAYFRRVILFGLCWLAFSGLTLYPTRNLFEKLGPYLSEHFLYFPAIGFVLILSSLLISLHKKSTRVIPGVAIYYVGLLLVANSYWTTEQSLLLRVFMKEKKEAVAYQQLLMKYIDSVPLIEKMIAQEKKASLKSLWMKRLGNVYRKHGRHPLAIVKLREAVRLNPKNLSAAVELAVCYLETGRTGDGLALLHEITVEDPRNNEAERILGEYFQYAGDCTHALAHFKKALALDPDDNVTARHIADCLQK